MSTVRVLAECELYHAETGNNPYTVYHHVTGPTEEYVKWLEAKIARLSGACDPCDWCKMPGIEIHCNWCPVCGRKLK